MTDNLIIAAIGRKKKIAFDIGFTYYDRNGNYLQTTSVAMIRATLVRSR